MSAEENKAVVRRMIEEVWSDHNHNVIDEVVSPDYFNHAAVPEHQRGLTGAKHIVNWLMAAFPDTRFDIEDIIADGDMVAIRSTASGTHEGEFVGIPQRANVSPFSRRIGSASPTARWPNIGRSGTTLA